MYNMFAILLLFPVCPVSTGRFVRLRHIRHMRHMHLGVRASATQRQLTMSGHASIGFSREYNKALTLLCYPIEASEPTN